MDNPHLSPRLSAYPRTFAQSALSGNSHASVVADMPVVPQRPYRAPVDFAARAKSYRRSQIKRKALKGVFIFGIVVMLMIAALGAVGYVLNERYAGRALPYTYVGDISIGGLTQPEIKAVLDARAEEIRVTLKEGGLTREVPVQAFGAQFDTQKASEQAITGFNPFRYLTKRAFAVSVTVNERYVDGYLRLHVANMQTDAENAEIVKSKKQLVIVPETYGFRTNTAYVTEQLNKQLVTLENPTVNLSAVTDRPAITQADLQDDIETARRLIATNVGVQAYKTVIRPSDDQKLSWLDIQQVPGTNQVQLQFSQAKVREYVFEIAKKYNTEAVAEQLTTNPDGTQTVQAGKAGSVVANVDDVANALYKALSNQQSQVIAFTINPVDYQKVDRSQVQMTQTTTAAATTTNQSGSLSQATAQQAIAGVN